MDEAKLAKLKAKGIEPTTVKDFLGLSPVDEILVELRVRLSREVRARREAGKMTQTDLAERMESSQPRLAKIEANQPGVSLDQLIHAFLAAGGTTSELGTLISETRS